MAQGKAKVIEGDLATGNFDPSLAKYKPERQNQITAPDLFQRFMENRSKQVYDRTLVKYQGLLNKLEAFWPLLPAIAINSTEALKFKEQLATQVVPITLKERIGLLSYLIFLPIVMVN